MINSVERMRFAAAKLRRQIENGIRLRPLAGNGG